ncbi:VacJ family lipoprotein [Zhongshania sp.]|uniref:MlaA family lipoprotein n=1 Tax=Zhongshania sp. TaxID=1971902 RepID=UPI001B65BEC3|nr:VacJ family lipoprotein [Zhongshania sp.]MBQ0796132.1 VacJ family lipoprotein [Zhongshania sp.]
MPSKHTYHQHSPRRKSATSVFEALSLSLLLLTTSLPYSSALAAGGNGEAAQQTSATVGDLSDDEITVVSYEESDYNDPLMAFNRAMFAFNDVSYRYVLIPVAKGYNYVTPAAVRTGIGNVFDNIKAPIHIINHLLQWEPAKAGATTARFLLNTTIGIAGIFDPAKAWFDLPKQETGFADTLAEYGSGYGSYLVLPFIGPSDLRGGTGVVADYFLNPIPHITEQPDTTYIMATDATQDFAGQAESYETLRAKSDDPYIFFRNMHIQGLLRDQQFKSDESQNASTQK